MTAIVQTRDLTRRYGATLALDHLTLEVPQGAIFGFIGPNGAGKSTLFSLLLQESTPDDGRVMMERGDFQGALVFVHTKSESEWGSAFILNELEPGTKAAPVFVRASDGPADTEALKAFPERKVIHVFGRDLTGDHVRIGVPKEK